MIIKFTRAQIAEAYGVTTTTVKRWIDAGAPFTLARPTRVDPIALHRWLYNRGEATDPIPPRAIMQAAVSDE